MNLATGQYSKWTPTLTLAVREQSRAQWLNLMLRDADGTSHQFRFDLRKLQTGVTQQVFAEYGAALGALAQLPVQLPSLPPPTGCSLAS